MFWVSLAILGSVGIIYLLIWFGPDVIARHDVGEVAGPQRATSLPLARDAARGRLLTLGAGLFAAGALIFTGRNYQLARQGQVTDRYTNAIQQLGSSELDVRIGGVYALERIAGDSVKDHPTVVEVLTAFIREHSREEWRVTLSATDTQVRGIRPDVQAAMTVIGRRDSARDKRRINLAQANLTRVDFTDANLAQADLTGADLSWADLAAADLTKATLFRANLSHAILNGADLSFANLALTNLEKASLIKANLTAANFMGADVTTATFFRANLRLAIFDADVAIEGWVRNEETLRWERAPTRPDRDTH